MFTDIKSKYGITDSFLMSVQSIVEAENEEFDYIAYFHGLKYEFKAKSLWDAKQKAWIVDAKKVQQSIKIGTLYPLD